MLTKAPPTVLIRRRTGKGMGLARGRGRAKSQSCAARGNPDHFDKLLEGPCPNHAFPVKHMYKDCSLMKRFFTGGSKKWEQKKPKVEADDAGEKDGGFPFLDGCLMIFKHPDSITHLGTPRGL